MTPDIELDPGFVFEGIPPIEEAVAAAAVAADPLGPLAQLPGTWKGTGFTRSGGRTIRAAHRTGSLS